MAFNVCLHYALARHERFGHDRGARTLVSTREMSHLEKTRAEIARWTDDGASRELVEERIDELPRSDEEKSVLWLWAWSCRNLRGEPEVESYRSVIGD